MSKNVLRITLAGTLCVATGAGLAQTSILGKTPTTGTATPGTSGLLSSIPSVSALTKPLTVPVTQTVTGVVQGVTGLAPSLTGVTQGVTGVVQGATGAVQGVTGSAVQGVTDLAHGLTATTSSAVSTTAGLVQNPLDPEKSATLVATSQNALDAAQSTAPQLKSRSIPFCD